jgi:hypothetical protein
MRWLVVSAHEVALPGEGNRLNKDTRKAGCNAVAVAKHGASKEAALLTPRSKLSMFSTFVAISPDERSRGRRSA